MFAFFFSPSPSPSPSPFLVVTQIRGHWARASPSSSLRYAPSFSSREYLRPFFPCKINTSMSHVFVVRAAFLCRWSSNLILYCKNCPTFFLSALSSECSILSLRQNVSDSSTSWLCGNLSERGGYTPAAAII